ncbi:MAG: DNA-binding response regulator [Anaerolineaceae bacterium]|nr:DNA-binding response regulator [Anaerolineaceae bacterium]
MTAKILIVDDEPGIRNLISAYLRKEGYQIYEADDGLKALQAARSFKPDIILLDIMLPGLDGLEVLSHLRRESDVYVILLTAKNEETDKVIGLSVGGDDYLTKPFSPRELVARIKAVLRRLQSPSLKNSPLTTQHLRLDPDSRQVWLENQPLDLTTLEFDLLLTFLRHHGQVLSREQLLEQVWGTSYFGETRVVDVHVGNIRRKLDNRFISTVRGIGYRFEDRS